MRFWHRFFSRWQNWLGLLLAVSFLIVSIEAPVISPQDEKNPGPFKIVGRGTDPAPHPPGENEGAVLGTLPFQYDVFHTLIWGTREAMQFGLLAAAGAFIFGVFFGAIAGYAGGALDSLMMRIADAFLTFPPLAGTVFLQQLAGIAINAAGGAFYFDARSRGNFLAAGEQPPLVSLLMRVDPLLISLILFSWMPYARLINTIVITLRRTEYVQAAQALGAGPFWVIRKHLLPHSIAPAIVLAARDVGSAVILQATLTFIGLGSTSAWGSLLSMGRNWVIGAGGDLLNFWWVYVPITAAVVLFGITWNLIGDGIGDALAPASDRDALLL